jgi:hypothetical protein
MTIRNSVLLLTATLSLSCFALRAEAANAATITDAQAAAVSKDVRAFAATVSRGVTQGGPAAWRGYFSESDAFFMVVDGHLAFTNSDAVTRDLPQIAASIVHIELQWGDSLRVDPLTPTLAMLAAPYHEILTDPAGHKVEASGYFTGLAELGPKGWRFRNATWSSAPAPPSKP